MADDLKTVVRAMDGDVLQPMPTVVTMPAWQMVLVRAVRVYLQALVGFLTANLSGLAAAVGVPVGEFGNAVKVAAMLAVAPATISLLQNIIEILTNLDVIKPTLRA